MHIERDSGTEELLLGRNRTQWEEYRGNGIECEALEMKKIECCKQKGKWGWGRKVKGRERAMKRPL
jgi:hypothetical protein